MEYRIFPKTGEKVSLFGVGTMRLPVINGQMDKINESEAVKMIRTAIDSGVNYIDTAYMYHNGNSESVVGKALKDGYREKVFLADKLPVWLIKEKGGDPSVIIEEQFKRLEVDYIDMYLMHNLESSNWKRVSKYNCFEAVEKYKKQGKIKHIGFSFHDEYELFEEIIDAYDWDFCQIQLNFMDINYQAGVKGLKYAASKGIPVVIMEPLKGGKLVDSIPESVQALWNSAPVKRTPAEWGLRWVADFPEVLTVLSGVSNMDQLTENIRIFSDAKENSLTDDEHKIIKAVSDEYNNRIKASCTACRYCLPCPQKIEIPDVINHYNSWHLFDGNPKVKGEYEMFTPQGRGAGDCVDCKQCEEKCPQHLKVAKVMANAKEVFGR